MKIKINGKSVKRMLKDLEIRANDSRPFFVLLGVKLRNMVVTMFRESGGRYGRASWPPIDKSMYEVIKRKDGKGDRKRIIRKGTDGSKKRLYSPSSKPLQASGGYMKSFKTQKATSKGMIFGSRLSSPSNVDLGYNIQFAGGKKRYVMPVWKDTETQSEISGVFKSFAQWIAGGRK